MARKGKEWKHSETGSKQCQFQHLHCKHYAHYVLPVFINVSDSKPSKGPEKAQGQKMPFCEILWNWRPVSDQWRTCSYCLLHLYQMYQSRIFMYHSSAWIKVEQLKPYHTHKEEMIKINKGKRFQQAVDSVEDYLKKAKGKEQVRLKRHLFQVSLK